MLRRTALLSLFACLTVGVSACSGPARAKPEAGVERRIKLHSYRKGQFFELIDEATRSRVEHYSEKRANANSKVLPSDVMDGFVEFLSDNEFNELAVDGVAPAQGSDGMAWALEFVEGGKPRYVFGYPPQTKPEQKRKLDEMLVVFLEVYGSVYSMQVVDVKPGETPFQAATPAQKRP
ncbi:MAG: hypothetical protein JNN27_05150 [Planctomycetes bacterium]|nr:hypothetical protein [Planctomycetota bacterium]